MIGTRLAHYEITSHLGSGGMGDVYQATDTKLGRSVAIKFLPEGFSGDAERVARFQREARVLASLSHPNIAHIYGLEECDKTSCIVMELVEGETLQERLQNGPIPMKEALSMAMEIAMALEAAHERGIIHRDLKPANIKVTPDGKIKVLDFGLAKVFQQEQQPALSNSPTFISMAATNTRVILGTAAYMSPEQAKGVKVDRASDVWAFGCVLYEMLTGHVAFDGETIGEILGAVFKSEPDWQRLPADAPEAIRRLLRRCLEKDRAERLKSADDARIEIKDALSEPSSHQKTALDPASRQSRFAWIVAAAAMLGLGSLAVVHFRERPVPEAQEMRLEINTPPTSGSLEFALSPDGRYITFVASGGGPQRLWVRALDQTEAQPIAGTEGADFPFWSPDSRSIGFTAAGKLKRVDIAGGSPQVLANTLAIFGGAWNSDGTILFNAAPGPFSRVSAAGGDVVPVTRAGDSGLVQHRFPQFLPDGRHFVFYGLGAAESSGIYMGSLDSGELKRLTASNSAAGYLNPGLIAFIRGTTLMAQRLDTSSGELVGDPLRIAAPVSDAIGLLGFSVSSNGAIAYRNGAGLRQLKWYDRTGKPNGVAAEPDVSWIYPELSPDGNRVALTRFLQGNTDIWLSDIARGGVSRFTFDSGIEGASVWSPDGTQIVYLSSRTGHYDLYLKSSSGTGAEELLLASSNDKAPQDWSRDRRFLLYYETNPKTARDLWALPIREAQGRQAAALKNDAGEREPIPVANTPFDEFNGQFSPDGHWVAYETNESGRFEIVVQPFPTPSGKWQVSTGGGIQPRWSTNGKELYFISPEGKLMAASVSATGSNFGAGTPAALFTASPATGLGVNKHEYAVSRDGRFLINQQVESSITSPITLILNWHPKP